VKTSYSSSFTFGQCWYTLPAGPPVRELGPIPPSPKARWWMAVSLPSVLAPSRTVIRAPGEFPLQSCSSRRSSMSLTGAPAFRASRQAMMAKALPTAEGYSLLPKPPPMCSMITRTFFRSRSNASARAARTMKMPCVEV